MRYARSGRILFIWVAAMTLATMPPAAMATGAAKSAPAKPAAAAAAAAACASTCADYQKSSLLERVEAIKSGCPNYVSAISDPVVARIRLAPEVAGSLGSAVDDDLWLEINGRDLWHRSFRNKDASETSWKKDVLKGGCNTVNLFFANTKEPDAYFMVDVGGVAFCGASAPCGRRYREGIEFGTGLIYKSPAVQAVVWNSKLADPNIGGTCRCEDPSLGDLYQKLAPFIIGPRAK